MGDRRVRPLHQNGVLVDQNASQLPFQAFNHLTPDIPRESWQIAEEVTQRIIWRIQPTKVSERRRRDVVDYVQRLIRVTLRSEVFAFGSVPLKTYLPDGDIDLTAICIPDNEEKFADAVCGVLKIEEQSVEAEFDVKDVQPINADVKLVKCLVQNIVVDISFNQIGGLCTLCFLEEVDRKIGKNNLFKRSIILIKAWCYYESRILGAHHSLISTYALETLVLYIFHIFHSSLNGPLEVLYIFLDYFSKFDWDNFCVSLRGPVYVSSLPQIVVARSDHNGSDHLLSKEFLDECMNTFSIPPKKLDINSRSFVKKHLNIVDPLKENNNLGRSVSKGNFHRIRSAFSYGARKLGNILSLSKEDITCALNSFFMNTLERHGSGERPDVRDIDTYNDGVPPHVENYSDTSTDARTGIDMVEKINRIKESERAVPNFLQDCCMTSRRKCAHGISPSDCLSQNASDRPFAEIMNENLENSCEVTDTVKSVSNPIKEAGQSKLAEFQKTHMTLYEFPTDETVSKTYCRVDGVDFTEEQIPHGSRTIVAAVSNGGTDVPLSRSMQSNGISEPPSPSSGISLDSRHMAELSGDQVAQSNDLSTAKMLHNSLSREAAPRNLMSRYRGRHPWDAFHPSNVYPHMNGVISSPFHYDSNLYINFPFITSSNGKEDLPRPRGTGIFFPNTQTYHQTFKDKPSHGRGRNPLATQAQKYRNNNQAVTPPKHNDKGEHAPERMVLSPMSRDGDRAISGKLDSPRASTVITKASSEVSDVKSYHVEIGTFGPIPLDVSIADLGKRLETNNLNGSSSASTHSRETLKPRQFMNEERSEHIYHLKDEGDFPPLLGQGQPTASTQPKLQKTPWGSRSRSSVS